MHTAARPQLCYHGQIVPQQSNFPSWVVRGCAKHDIKTWGKASGDSLVHSCLLCRNQDPNGTELRKAKSSMNGSRPPESWHVIGHSHNTHLLQYAYVTRFLTHVLTLPCNPSRDLSTVFLPNGFFHMPNFIPLSPSTLQPQSREERRLGWARGVL